MARIRSLKPELPSDRKLTTVPRDARYTFVLLISQADDDGLVRAEPRQLLGVLYPFDEDVDSMLLEGWLEELAGIEVIRFRQTRDGMRVIQIANWERHQVIKNRSKPFLLNLLVETSENPVHGSVGSPDGGGSVSGGPGGAESRVLSPESRSQESRVLSPESSVPSEPASRVAEAAAKGADQAEPVAEPLTRSEPLAQVAGAVRKVWWLPDGQAPAGWTMGRELSIWRPILESGVAVDQCIAVIHGASYLQLAGGVYGRGDLEPIDWLKRGEKITGRVFKNTRLGAVPLWTLALEAYDRGPPPAPASTKKPTVGRREKNEPAPLSKLLPAGRGR